MNQKRPDAVCIKCGQSFDEAKQSNWGPFTCSWHPRNPQIIGNTGPRGDYSDLWYYPCCGQGVEGKIVNGKDVEPPRAPGCTNGFHSATRPRIFLSYAHVDARFGGFIENELKRRSYQVWKDSSELLPGADWPRVINDAMDQSTHFIILLSPRSIARPEVNRELGAALQARKPIIPILLEDCDVPAPLQNINHIDWRKGQDNIYSNNFRLLDDALADVARMALLEEIRNRNPSPTSDP